MRIVIDIPEKYKKLLDSGEADGSIRKFILLAVANGIILPEQYGRLIDADKFLEIYAVCGYIDDMSVDYFNAVTPTIIEASNMEK